MAFNVQLPGPFLFLMPRMLPINRNTSWPLMFWCVEVSSEEISHQDSENEGRNSAANLSIVSISSVPKQ